MLNINDNMWICLEIQIIVCIFASWYKKITLKLYDYEQKYL